jgi:hypothetical protein
VPGLDTSTLNPVTPNYVARPIFAGVADPVPLRSMLIAGETDAVAVPDLREPARAIAGWSRAPVEPHPYAAPRRGLSFKATRPERYMLTCVRAVAEARVGDRHPTIVRVAARLYGLAKGGSLDRDDVTARILGAVALSSFDRDAEEVYAALRWAWEHADPWRLP